MTIRENDENQKGISYKEYENLKKRQAAALRQIEASKIKSMIFANLAHDLKTPIAVIESAVQMLETDISLDEKERENNMRKHLSFIKYNSNALLRMIKNITIICNMESGNYILEKQKCNIISVIENKVMSMIPYAQHKGINIIFDTEIEEQYMECDIDKIEAIMQNLISNAIKYGYNKGEIKVDIVSRSSELSIIVKDNGKGIPKHRQEGIFERYSRGESLTDAYCEGSGIGLFLVKTIVDMHNGKIKLDSEVCKGSTFEVILPIL